MPLPPEATILERPMDPTDLVEYTLNLSQGDLQLANGKWPILASNESVASFSISVTPEAVAAGVRIRSDPDRAPTLTGKTLRFWPEVDPEDRGSAIFNGSGIMAAFEVTITTNAAPSRTKQRTVGIPMRNL